MILFGYWGIHNKFCQVEKGGFPCFWNTCEARQYGMLQQKWFKPEKVKMLCFVGQVVLVAGGDADKQSAGQKLPGSVPVTFEIASVYLKLR